MSHGRAVRYVVAIAMFGALSLSLVHAGTKSVLPVRTIQVMGTPSSRSSVMFDLDGDGDLDIVTNNFNSAPQVFISDLAQLKNIHWIKIALAGTILNREGLGATVRVRAGGQVYTKYNYGRSGYLSQSDLPLYFGLGDATTISSVQVDWPSGRKQVFGHVAGVNQTLTITEPP